METMDTTPSFRTQVKRSANRASHDKGLLHAIIDAAWVCNVAFRDAHGVHGIPTACWRIGEHLYIHGSNGSRMIRCLLEAECCVTITHVDGLVLARSAFNHSMNYRSAMIYGRFEAVDDSAKRPALEAFMEHLAPGRQAQIRPGNDKEYAATTVLRIALDEAACKTRGGPPEDDEEDMALPAWAGVLPLREARGAPVADAGCNVAAPDYVRRWQD